MAFPHKQSTTLFVKALCMFGVIGLITFLVKLYTVRRFFRRPQKQDLVSFPRMKIYEDRFNNFSQCRPIIQSWVICPKL
jgi:flagellar biogenesis protein FliO